MINDRCIRWPRETEYILHMRCIGIGTGSGQPRYVHNVVIQTLRGVLDFSCHSEKGKTWRICQAHDPIFSGQLLLDEKGSKVRQLPSASDTQNHELEQSPSDHARIRRFRLITELGFALL